MCSRLKLKEIDRAIAKKKKKRKKNSEKVRLDSDIESKSLNNTYLNTVKKLLFFHYKQHYKQHRLEKTGLFK